MTCILCYAVITYTVIMLIRIILSWITMAWSPPHSMAPAIRVLYDLTEPVLRLFRRYIPPIGMLDISAIVVFVVLALIRQAVCGVCA